MVAVCHFGLAHPRLVLVCAAAQHDNLEQGLGFIGFMPAQHDNLEQDLGFTMLCRSSHRDAIPGLDEHVSLPALFLKQLGRVVETPSASQAHSVMKILSPKP